MSNATLDPVQRAANHPIVLDKPAVRFFEGALLGNGGLGATVCTRPDAVMIHFGHNAVWDVRVDESHKEHIGTFADVFEKVNAVPKEYASLDEDPWCRDYFDRMRGPYRKPYPRPFPCGTLLLAFDRRRAELLGHRLDISTGVCAVDMLVDGTPARLHIFCERTVDRLWMRMVDGVGQPIAAPFNRILLIPDPETPAEFSPATSFVDEPQGTMAFTQVLPALPPENYDPTTGDPRDMAFRLCVQVSGHLARPVRENWQGNLESMGDLERAVVCPDPFVAWVQLDHGLAATLAGENPRGETPAVPSAVGAALTASQIGWQEYWRRSGVALDDTFLEKIWYWNLYFLNCALRPGVTCPGLFANWSYRNIGTAWHGDYHMNYNTQQPFWATFSSNHVDKHLPYVDLVEFLLPLSRRWAQEYYGLRGAYFPHTAYPVEMTVMPYPVPDWGWEICETPWTVQSLWWHYRYTLDADFLRQRAFEPIKASVEFLVDYVRRPEAHGPQWGDDRYHIFPTVPPELYGLRPGFDRCFDCLVDLTLTRFVLKAYLAACDVLHCQAAEAELMRAVEDVLAHLPDYPTAHSAQGTVFVSVPGENAETVYNVPGSTMTVFPGEEHGLGSSPEEFALAANSYRQQRNEGGNDLVFLAMQGARLGLLDLEQFKRQVHYSLLPNGTCTDMVMQTLGRYSETTHFDFMAPMGIWFENFALPGVINECLLQGYDGLLRLFPNWPAHQAAEFRTLRTVGAFLVSAAFAEGKVQWVEIQSEAGGMLRVEMPQGWANGARVQRADGEEIATGRIVEIATAVNEVIRLRACQL